MDFELDPEKSNLNQNKHGLNFERAEDFEWASAVIKLDERQNYREVRYKAIGYLENRLHAVSFTYRQSAIRIISFRKASRQERNFYAHEVKSLTLH